MTVKAESALQRAVYETLRMIEDVDLTDVDLVEANRLAEELEAVVSRLCDLAETRAKARRARSADPSQAS